MEITNSERLGPALHWVPDFLLCRRLTITPHKDHRTGKTVHHLQWWACIILCLSSMVLPYGDHYVGEMLQLFQWKRPINISWWLIVIPHQHRQANGGLCYFSMAAILDSLPAVNSSTVSSTLNVTVLHYVSMVAITSYLLGTYDNITTALTRYTI